MKKWNKEETARAVELAAANVSSFDIATQLGRTLRSVNGRLDYVQRKAKAAQERKLRGKSWRRALGQNVTSGVVPPADLVADAQRRRDMEHTSVTAWFCGDPLPGRSALDQKRMESTR